MAVRVITLFAAPIGWTGFIGNKLYTHRWINADQLLRGGVLSLGSFIRDPRFPSIGAVIFVYVRIYVIVSADPINWYGVLKISQPVHFSRVRVISGVRSDAAQCALVEYWTLPALFWSLKPRVHVL